MEWLFAERWSPYVVGAGIGVLSWFAFLLMDKGIGCSTAFARTSGMLEQIFRGKATLERPYFKEFAPKVDWEWMLVLGVFGGAFLSAHLSGSLGGGWVPPLWAEVFGDEVVPRLFVAFIGGILMGVGSRWAGGCTSGHGITGTLQLALSSWIAAVCFFISGIAAAMILFRLVGGQ